MTLKNSSELSIGEHNSESFKQESYALLRSIKWDAFQIQTIDQKRETINSLVGDGKPYNIKHLRFLLDQGLVSVEGSETNSSYSITEKGREFMPPKAKTT